MSSSSRILRSRSHAGVSASDPSDPPAVPSAAANVSRSTISSNEKASVAGFRSRRSTGATQLKPSSRNFEEEEGVRDVFEFASTDKENRALPSTKAGNRKKSLATKPVNVRKSLTAKKTEEEEEEEEEEWNEKMKKKRNEKEKGGKETKAKRKKAESMASRGSNSRPTSTSTATTPTTRLLHNSTPNSYSSFSSSSLAFSSSSSSPTAKSKGFASSSPSKREKERKERKKTTNQEREKEREEVMDWV